MNKTFEVERAGKRRIVVMRQEAHDKQYRVGSRIAGWGKVIRVIEDSANRFEDLKRLMETAVRLRTAYGFEADLDSLKKGLED